MILRTLFVALAGVTVWKWAAARRSRMQDHPVERKPHAENLWEGEGGALRESGAQLGPEPSVVAKPA